MSSEHEVQQAFIDVASEDGGDRSAAPWSDFIRRRVAELESHGDRIALVTNIRTGIRLRIACADGGSRREYWESPYAEEPTARSFGPVAGLGRMRRCSEELLPDDPQRSADRIEERWARVFAAGGGEEEVHVDHAFIEHYNSAAAEERVFSSAEIWESEGTSQLQRLDTLPQSHIGEGLAAVAAAEYERDNDPSLESWMIWVRADRAYCEAVAIQAAATLGGPAGP